MNNKDNKILLLTELFRSFQTGIRSAKALKAKAYLSSIGLSYESFNLGFNSGQFHHRESETYKKDYESIGVLTHNPNVVINKEGRVAYTVFGNYSIAYTLKNGKGEIVNLFADRFNLETPQRLFLYKGSGIFPSYPKANTKKLFVCYDPIEAETLLQSGILKNEEAVISLLNGEISQEIEIMLNELEGLQQIVFIS